MKRLTVLLMIVFAGVSLANYQSPYFDDTDTTGLWHMQYIDGGDIRDDNSVDLVREANIDLAGGTTVVSPVDEGIGYPAGNSAFGYCMHLDGVDDNALIMNTGIEFDLNDVCFEGWFKADAATDGTVLLDRWGQLVIWAQSNRISVYAWDSLNVVNTGINAYYSTSGAVPTDWTHFAVEILNDELKVYINGVDSATAAVTGGLVAEPSKGATYIGRRYNGGNLFAGYVDEYRISKASVLPSNGVKTDKIAGFEAIWHLDELADPIETGLAYEVTPDDDSANAGRSNDITLKDADVDVAVASGTGPAVVAPVTEGIGYPYGISSFANCMKFDGVDDNLAISNSTVNVDLENFAIECWVKPDESITSLTGGGNSLQYVFDRWGEICIRFDHLDIGGAGERFRYTAMIWDNELADEYIYGYCDTLGIDPTAWAHLKLVGYEGQQRFYINGVLVGTSEFSITPTTRVSTRVGARYSPQDYFFGYIDEVSIGQAVYVAPEWTVPHVDTLGEVSALWHFDEFADPNTSGTTDELLLDDDSANPGRDADLKLYSLNSVVGAGDGDGPTLVDPDVEGIGYPMGDPAFGNCAFFDDPVLVEADSFRAPIGDVVFDSSNVSIQFWLRPAEGLLEFTPAQDTFYYIFDRWSQIVFRFIQKTNGDYQVQAIVWDAQGSAGYLNATYSSLGIDPSDWVHVEFENYQGAAALYVNGSLTDSSTLATPGLGSPNKSNLYIGSRYSPQEWFWGYMDEMMISQVVGDIPCGAWDYLDGDLSQDCVVNLLDYAMLADEWLADYTIDGSGSDNYPVLTEDFWPLPGNYNIPRATVTPAIDGTIATGEWEDARTIEMIYPTLTEAPNTGTLRPGTSEPDNNADFSLWWYVKWDDNYLYVLGVTYDDIYNSAAGQDEPQLCFNYLNDIAATYLTEAFVWNLAVDGTINTNGGPAPTSSDLSGQLNSGLFGDSYVLEARFAWSDLEVGTTGYNPVAGDIHGFGLACQDHDAGGTREHFLLDFGSGAIAMDDLSTWNTVTLVEEMPLLEAGTSIADLNLDAFVDPIDLKAMAADWLNCTDPMDASCVDAR